MKAIHRPAAGHSAALAALLLPGLLTACSLLPATRKLPIPKPPLVTQTVNPEELVDRLNQRAAAINTLSVTVEMQASVIKSNEGTAKDYPSVHGQVLLRKPGDLRVLGRYFGVTAFDMASDGDCFTLSIPHDDKVIKGCGPSKTKSANAWENLRPGFFFDAMMVRGLDAADQYQVVIDSETLEDAARKHLFLVPEYILSISRRNAGTQKLTPVRVVTVRRDNLLPYQQDLYDAGGNVETQVTYGTYQDFDGTQFPATVTIKRPLEGIQIVLTVDRVTENHALANDQFVVPVPAGSKIQNVQ